MFDRARHWFRSILGLRPAKDTEACRLKEAIASGVADCKEKAAKGDSDASMRLGRLKDNITEQSLRMPSRTGGPRPMLLMIAVLALAIGGGCSGGLGAKTAKDIAVAVEMIAPEYLQYVEADPKLKDAQKQDRKNQVRALQDVIRAAQK
jgi:hypothetical protein